MKPSPAPAGASSVTASSYAPAGLAWLIWGFAAIFYMFVFFLRAAPAVMTSELMRDFHIGGASLGNLSAFYFYAYVLMQIPVGVLTDSMGARKLLMLGAFTAALGTFIFGSTDSFGLACIGRAILGGSTAVALLVALRLAAHWFPSKNFGAMSGIALLFGNMGAVVAQIPLRLAIEHFTWRETVIGSAVIVFLLGVLAWLLVRDDPSEKGYKSYASAALTTRQKTTLAGAFKSMGSVFSYTNTWLILIAQGGLAGTILSYTGLWGAPFAKARYGLAPRDAASIATVMLVAFAAGCPVFGAISDKLGRRKPAYLAGAAVTALGWISMFYIDGLSLSAFTVIAGITGFATGSFIIGFPYGRESAPGKYMGTMTATVNMGNMLGVVALQPGIGVVLDQHWTGQLVKGARVYSVDAFHTAFMLIAGWAVLAVILIAMTRETYCKPVAG
jgi:sugar phosphate permease